MELTDFREKIKDANNPYSRLLGQQIVSLLKQNCRYEEIEVAEETFSDITTALKVIPTETIINKFIRVYDLDDNVVDIKMRK